MLTRTIVGIIVSIIFLILGILNMFFYNCEVGGGVVICIGLLIFIISLALEPEEVLIEFHNESNKNLLLVSY